MAVSLVPTQLTRLLGDANAIAALQPYSAILIGGSAILASVSQARQRYGLKLDTTYGMSETCGG